MTTRAVLGLSLLLLILAGCAAAPSGQPSTNAGSVTSSPSVTVSPSSPPVASSKPIVIPTDCEQILSRAFVKQNVSERYELFDDSAELYEFENDIVARNGINCFWTVPSTDYGRLYVSVAPIKAATDSAQIEQWKLAGYSECSSTMAACFCQNGATPFGYFDEHWWEVYALADGMEISIRGDAKAADIFQKLATEVASNLGGA